MRHLRRVAHISILEGCLSSSEKEAAVIRTAFDRGGEFAAAISCADDSRESPTMGWHGNVQGDRSCRRTRLSGCQSPCQPGRLKALVRAGNHGTGRPSRAGGWDRLPSQPEGARVVLLPEAIPLDG